MPTNCKQLRADYEAFMAQTADLALSVSTIRALEREGEPIDIEQVRTANRAMKRLKIKHKEFSRNLLYSVETIVKILGEKNLRPATAGVWPKSEDNPHAIEPPSRDYLVPEVERTPPEQAVKMLEKMYQGLNTKKWEAAFERGVTPAINACKKMGIDPRRLVVFPWIKRKALARYLPADVSSEQAGLQETKEKTPHYGALIEQAIFPKLAEAYKEKGLGFTNYRAGQMSDNEHLQMEPAVAKWLDEREEETEGDICFSAVLLDPFKGYSIGATRHETKKETRMIDGTSYLVQQMLLTQIQVLSEDGQQRFFLPGDKYDSTGASSFSAAPCCLVRGSRFRFVSVSTDGANARYGALVLPFAI